MDPLTSKEKVVPCPHGHTPDLCRLCMRAEIERLQSDNEANRDMLQDARLELAMLREALGVDYEPHQNLFERMIDAANHKRVERTAHEPPVSLLAAEINALPERVRQFVHDLEARADPAGDVRRAHVAEENAAALAVRVSELENAAETEHVCDGGWACHFHDVKVAAQQPGALRRAIELADEHFGYPNRGPAVDPDCQCSYCQYAKAREEMGTAQQPCAALPALEHVLKVFKSMADRGRYPIELLPHVEGERNPHYLGKQGWEFLTDAIDQCKRTVQPSGAWRIVVDEAGGELWLKFFGPAGEGAAFSVDPKSVRADVLRLFAQTLPVPTKPGVAP